MISFDEWKKKFGHKHVSEEMKQWLKQLEEMEQRVASNKFVDHLRLRELREFAKKIERLLEAEWKLFIEVIEGTGPSYC